MDGISFKKWSYPTSLFTNLDATYILYLAGSPRISKIREQISKLAPTKIIYLVTNLGYKNVKRPILPEQTSIADTGYCHYVASKHALQHNYNNVLIFEDDFIFEDSFLTADIDSIENFLQTDIQRYFLGCMPFLLLPASWDLKHWKLVGGGTAHAIIHKKKGLEKFVQDYEADPKKILYIDMYFASQGAYTYYKPLCTQTFPQTENRTKNWGNTKTMSGFLFSSGIELLNLDKKTQPGTNIMYWVAKILPWVILLIIVLIIYWIWTKIRYKKDSKLQIKINKIE